MKISELSEGPEREALVKQFGEDADVMQVAKGFIETKNKLSSTMRVPDSSDPPDRWNSLYDKLGRPESADKYELPDAPETLKPVIEQLRSVAYDKGLSQDQFAALATQAGAVSAEADKQLADARQEWESKIREKHGDTADQRLAEAQHSMEKILADDPMTAGIIKRFGLDKHPAIMDAFLKAGAAMSNDRVPGVGASPPQETHGPSPTDLYKEGMEVMRSDAYKSQNHPENKLAQARITEIVLALNHQGYDGFRDPRFRVNPTVTLPDGTRLIG